MAQRHGRAGATLLRPGERGLSAERITERGHASRTPARPETRTPALATAAAIHRRATERRQQREHEQLNARARLLARARAEFAPNHHPTTPTTLSGSATAPHEITSSAEIHQRVLERARAERAGRGDRA